MVSVQLVPTPPSSAVRIKDSDCPKKSKAPPHHRADYSRQELFLGGPEPVFQVCSL